MWALKQRHANQWNGFDMLIENDEGPSLAMYCRYELSDWFLKICKDSREFLASVNCGTSFVESLKNQWDHLPLFIIKHAIQSLASYNGYKCFDWSLWSCEGSHDFPHVLDMCTSSEGSHVIGQWRRQDTCGNELFVLDFHGER